jgi:hypothetical protein
MDRLDSELTRSMPLRTIRFISAIKNNGDLGRANSDGMGYGMGYSLLLSCKDD